MTWSIERFILEVRDALVSVGREFVRDPFAGFMSLPRIGHDTALPDLPANCPDPVDCISFGCAGGCSEADDCPPELVSEVCRVHRDPECIQCDDDNDDMWVHPRDLPESADDDDVPDPTYLGDVEKRFFASVPKGPPEPTEPPLSDDELVGVRGLLQERYNPELRAQGPEYFAGAAASLADESDPFGAGNYSSVSEDKQPVAPHTTSPVREPPLPAGERAAGVEPSPSVPPAAHLNVLSWQGWAVPAIMTVLEENRPTGESTTGDVFWWAWCEWVAPLIADAIGCCPDRAVAALLGQPDPSPTPDNGPGSPLVGGGGPAADSGLRSPPAAGHPNDQDWAAGMLRRLNDNPKG